MEMIIRYIVASDVTKRERVDREDSLGQGPPVVGGLCDMHDEPAKKTEKSVTKQVKEPGEEVLWKPRKQKRGE